MTSHQGQSIKNRRGTHGPQARSQPARWGCLNLDGWNTRRTPPLGHCPRDVINLKNAPTLGHSQAPPPLDIVRVTSSTYSKGGTKLLKGGTKLLKGGTKLLKGGTKLLKGGTKLLKGGTKLLKGGTKSLGWATGGVVRPPPRPPPPPPGYGPGPPVPQIWCNSDYYLQSYGILNKMAHVIFL